jgi:hypothetical protein
LAGYPFLLKNSDIFLIARYVFDVIIIFLHKKVLEELTPVTGTISSATFEEIICYYYLLWRLFDPSVRPKESCEKKKTPMQLRYSFHSLRITYSSFLPACNLKYSYCNPLTVTVDFPDDLLVIE